MARTAVDLPDPMENASDAALGGADDLLAQLAGDEVDRLLSEADAAAPQPLNVDRHGAGPLPETAPSGMTASDLSAETVKNANESALDDLLNEIDDARLPPDPEPDAIGSPADQLQSAEETTVRRADKLMARARQQGDDPAVAEEGLEILPEPTGDIASAAAPVAPAPASAADALAVEMEDDERAHAAALRRMQQLGDAPDAAASAALEELPASARDSEEQAEIDPADAEALSAAIDEAIDYSPDLDDEPAEVRAPLLVRVLEWVNAPLVGLPSGARQAVGKIALVTSVNAIAVFAYVLIFRRH